MEMLLQEQDLEKLRDKLLDLSGRNSLIKFKFNKSCLRLIDELPDQIFDTLVSGKKMTFEPVREPREDELIQEGYISVDPETQIMKEIKSSPTAEQWAKILGLDTNYSVPDDDSDNLEKKHNDNLIQTLLYPKEMESRLRGIFRKTSTILNETGANTLYLCLGFLKWDADESSKEGLAPLFTIPVNITKGSLNKEKGVYEYTIKFSGDDIIENLSLREKLKRDFDLALPEFGEDESPEKYFKKVNSFINTNKPKWKIERFITLGLLQFQKSLMYRDLDPKSLLQNELINQIISGVEKDGDSSGINYVEDYDIDNYGKQIHENYPLLFDADSSQHSAIIDALDGKNLVIKGPPGTGKSQTISNLIAVALSQGKSVLFMAEKQAALNIVHDKLSTVGLSDFCLNLHSKETNKKTIMKSLDRRINARNSYKFDQEYEYKISKYEQLKKQLNDYVELIHSNVSDRDLTIYQILSTAAANKKYIDEDLLELDINTSEVNKTKIQDSVDKLNSFKEIYKAILKDYKDAKDITDHNWYGFNNKDFQSYNSDNVEKKLKALNLNLKQLEELESDLKSNYQFFKESSDFRMKSKTSIDIDSLIKQAQSFDYEKAEYINPKKVKAYDDCLKSFQQLVKIKNKLSDLDISDLINKRDNYPIQIPESFHFLKANKCPNDLFELGEKINGLEKKTHHINEIFGEVNSLLGGSFLDRNCKRKDLNQLDKIIKAVNVIPSVSISKRDIILDNEKAFELFFELKRSVSDCKKLESELSESFSLDSVPNKSRLVSISRVLEDKSIFRWFKKDFRNARKEVLHFASDPYLKLNHLIKLLPRLIQLDKLVKAINQEKFRKYFAKFLAGSNTNIEIIESVISWYKTIADVFGNDAKVRNALKEISDKNLTDLSKVVSSNKMKSIELLSAELKECLDFFSAAIVSENSISSMKKIIEKIKLAKSELIDFFDGISFLGSKNDSKTIYNERLKTYHEFINANNNWEKIDRNLYCKNYEYLSNDDNFNKVQNTIRFLFFLANDCDKSLAQYISENLNQDAIVGLEKVNKKINDKFASLTQSLNAFKEVAQLDIDDWVDRDYLALNLSRKNELALNSIYQLDDLVEYLRMLDEMNKLGLKALCLYAIKRKKVDILPQLYKAKVYQSMALEVFNNNRDLRFFSSRSHAQKITDFSKVDHDLKTLNIGHIQKKIDSHTKTENSKRGRKVSSYTEMNLINNEVSKKKRHVPLRKLFAQAPKSIVSLKPCFMMSPMSVAKYLTLGKQIFDLVIMDEASQIRPQDAIGTIARGKQVVIVGDPKQLPPTNFFARSGDDEDEEEGLETQESILDATIKIFVQRTLRWHYRSRHESLIAFSNHNFYNDDLIVFPSPIKDRSKLGIELTKVKQGSFVDKRNLEEAKVVARAVKDHLMNSDESLGIVAMNIYQKNAIEQALEILAKQNNDKFASILDQRSNLPEEPLFVKNLENVQGDERDVMFISLTYGGARKYFGLNKTDDWRRLNVLLTRAKLRMHIFTSFSSSEVPSHHKSLGIKSLNKFLKYCETGEIVRTNSDTNRGPDSEFEVSVIEFLEAKGYQCVPQVGEAGFFIDVSVLDPKFPGEYLMGIECDGATYHSSKSARDRDRLRQQVLEGLGWNIKRIWSTDWFKNPEKTIAPIITELDKIKEKNKSRFRASKQKTIQSTEDLNQEFFDIKGFVHSTSMDEQSVSSKDN